MPYYYSVNYFNNIFPSASRSLRWSLRFTTSDVRFIKTCHVLQSRCHEVLKQHFQENKNALNIVIGKLNLRRHLKEAYCATSRKVAVSIPDGVTEIFH